MDTITFDDFAKIEIRIGTVLHAEVPEGSKKLLKYVVDFGELGERVIFSGIQEIFQPDDLVGKQLPFVFNLAPKKMGTLGESQGMLVAASPGEHGCVLLLPQHPVENGTQVI